jgi:hypothetical protein
MNGPCEIGSLATAVFLLGACQAATTPNNSPSPANPSTTQQAMLQPSATATGSAAAAATLTVSQALTQPEGNSLRVTGLYYGWKGPCQGKPPTRSAWQLVESNTPGAACVYVDGVDPRDVSPNAPPANVYVVVQGAMQLDGQTRYLQAQRVDRQ